MNRRSRSLLVSDLDGTLLRSDGTLSEATVVCIRRLVQDGLQFTVATARSPTRTRSVLRGLPLNQPLICLNGAATVDPLTGGFLSVASIPEPAVRSLLRIGAEFGLSPFLMGSDGGRERLMYQAPRERVATQFIAQRLGEPRLQLVDVLRPLEQTLCVTFADTASNLSALFELLKKEPVKGLELRLMAYPEIEGGATLDISLLGVDKVTPIAELAASLGVSPLDVIVFGDDLNDLPMFAWAGTAVAVANAKQEVLNAADVHCDTNDRDGVMKFIQSWSAES